MHLDQQVGNAGCVQGREQVLDGGDRRVVVALERGGVGRLAHRRDVRWDPCVRRQGDEVDAVVGRQRLQRHAGAAARVQAEPVEHGALTDRALRLGPFGHQAKGRRRLQPAIGVEPLGVRVDRRQQATIVGHRAAEAQAAVHRLDRLPVRQRLLQVVQGAHLERLDRGRGGAVAGHHHHRRGRIVLADRLQRLEAVPVRQPDVEEDDVRIALAIERQSLVTATRLERPETLVREHPRQRFQDPRLVVDDEDQSFLFHSDPSPTGLFHVR